MLIHWASGESSQTNSLKMREWLLLKGNAWQDPPVLSKAVRIVCQPLEDEIESNATACITESRPARTQGEGIGEASPSLTCTWCG